MLSSNHERKNHTLKDVSYRGKTYEIGGVYLTSAHLLTPEQEIELGKKKSEALRAATKALLSNVFVQRELIESFERVLEGSLVHKKGSFHKRVSNIKSSDQFTISEIELFLEKFREKDISSEEKIALLSKISLSERYRSYLVNLCKDDEVVQEALAHYKKAIEPFIVSNYGLVLSIAKSHSATTEQLQDNFSRGLMGLYIAVEKFNPKKGFRLSTYATHWIRREIIRGIQKEESAIRLPAHIHGSLIQIQKLNDIAGMSDGQELNEEEILALTGNPSLARVKIRFQDFFVSSLNDPLPNQDKTNLSAVDNIVDPSEDAFSLLVNEDQRTMLLSIIVQGCKSDLQREVLFLKYGLYNEEPLNVIEIAKRLKKTPQAIKQLERNAILNCRKYAIQRGFTF